jgi:hypothetical protein
MIPGCYATRVRFREFPAEVGTRASRELAHGYPARIDAANPRFDVVIEANPQAVATDVWPRFGVIGFAPFNPCRQPRVFEFVLSWSNTLHRTEGRFILVPSSRRADRGRRTSPPMAPWSADRRTPCLFNSEEPWIW